MSLGPEHAREAARLHCRTLGGLLSRLGPRAAEAFHVGAVRSGAAVAFAAVEAGVLQGFVLGAADPGELRRRSLRANPLGIVAGVFIGVVTRPAVVCWILESRRRPEDGSRDWSGPELTYLAVDPDRQGAGIGRQLVEAFGRALVASGATAYELSVDEGNAAAIAFYERLGFREVGRYREFGGAHRRYRLPLVRVP